MKSNFQNMPSTTLPNSQVKEAMKSFDLPGFTTFRQQLGLSVKLGNQGKSFVLGLHKGHEGHVSI